MGIMLTMAVVGVLLLAIASMWFLGGGREFPLDGGGVEEEFPQEDPAPQTISDFNGRAGRLLEPQAEEIAKKDLAAANAAMEQIGLTQESDTQSVAIDDESDLDADDEVYYLERNQPPERDLLQRTCDVVFSRLNSIVRDLDSQTLYKSNGRPPFPPEDDAFMILDAAKYFKLIRDLRWLGGLLITHCQESGGVE